MAERKSFLLRIDPAVLRALQRWADDDLRSLNGQIEYVLRSALRAAGRKVERESDDATAAEAEPAEGAAQSAQSGRRAPRR